MLRAANLEVVAAQLNMGFICAKKARELSASSEKQGEDEACAVAWFEKAMNQGDVAAALNLGLLHEQKGRRAESFRYLQKAAEGGHARAQHRLGLLFFEGVLPGGVEQSDANAATWWKKAVAQGNLDAHCSLGCLHLQGRGVKQSDAEAGKLFEAAAEKVPGETTNGACSFICVMALNAVGTPPS